MKIKLIITMILLTGTGFSFGAPSDVSDFQFVFEILTTDNINLTDIVTWQHGNPFTAQVGDYALTLLNSGIIGVELFVEATDTLWSADPLVNDALFIAYTDTSGTHTIIPVLDGINHAVISPADLGAMLNVEAVLATFYGPSTASIISSELRVSYESDLVVGGIGVNPVPAPGALLLGSLGCGLVGLVRRRF